MQNTFNTTIDTIPKEYFGCTQLVFRNVNKLPDNLNDCKKLNSIYIESSVIDTLDNIKSITSVIFAHCNIEHIIEDIKKMTQLKYLSLYECDLDYIPDFSMLKNLSSLHVQCNNIAEIPEYVQTFNVKRLSVSENSIVELKNLPSCIEYLEAYDNQFQNLDYIKNFKNLNVINVNGCELTHIPSFDGCDELMCINIGANPLTSVDENILNRKKLIVIDTNNFDGDEIVQKFKLCCRIFSTTYPNKNVEDFFEEYQYETDCNDPNCSEPNCSKDE